MSFDEPIATEAASVNELMRLFPGVLFSQSPDFKFSFVSSAVVAFTGLSPVDWCHQPAERFWEIVHGADAAELQQRIKLTAESSKVITSTFRIRNVITKQVTCVCERRQAVRDASGSLLRYDGVWLDVTPQMMSERHAQILSPEILTRLMDVLVHDFNNCMTGIHALCETMRFSTEAAHPFRESLDLLQQNANRSKEVIRRMADLTYCNAGTKTYHDLNELVTDGLGLVRKLVSPRIRVETALATESLPVYVNAAEFRQIIIKLAANAMNGMPQGGSLRFETSRHNKHPQLLHKCGNYPSLPCFCFAVSGTGEGMSKQCLDGIFNVFSENKPLTQDQDDGLHALGELVKALNGAITVESEEGKGATFRIWLPEADFTESDTARTAAS